MIQGLLQSEVEGVENENVGFYGRCQLHATHPLCESHSDPIDNELNCSREKELTCARTEVHFSLVEVFYACLSIALFLRGWGK